MLMGAEEQFTHELRVLFNRWGEESDLDDLELTFLACEALNELLEEDVIEFELEDDV